MTHHSNLQFHLITTFRRSIELAKKRKVGDPFAPDSEQGPQVDKAQFDKVLSYIKCGKEEGAKLVVGGDRVGKKGYFVQPTIFTDVTKEMKIWNEEIFGPVLAVQKVIWYYYILFIISLVKHYFCKPRAEIFTNCENNITVQDN